MRVNAKLRKTAVMQSKATWALLLHACFVLSRPIWCQVFYNQLGMSEQQLNAYKYISYNSEDNSVWKFPRKADSIQPENVSSFMSYTQIFLAIRH